MSFKVINVTAHCCSTILMSIVVVYYVNVQQHWSPWMISWCLLDVCTTSMCRNIDHLEWHIDVYWRCVLRQCAATLITLNDILMSIGGVYYVNVQQHWSPWMRPSCLLEVCTTSMCSNTDHLAWYLDVYWRWCYINVPQHLWSVLLHIDGVHTSNRHQGDQCFWALTSVFLHIDVVHTSSRNHGLIQGDQCCCTLT
jgi:hypothetical protein